MSNYTKTTDFEAKDSLPTGDSGKIIRGAEFETEFDAIATAITTKADTAGPTFTGTLTFETISDGTIGVTAFVDEDDMSSDSATLVPTQQSVKAYVDSVTTELQAQDLDFQADSGGALNIDLDTETMTFTGGTGIDTSGSGNTVTFDIDSTVTTLTGTQTLTNKTLTSPDVNTPDIDGGTIDGTVIGGATPAAVSATTVSATGNITVGGTVDGRDVATDGSKLDGIEASADVTDTANVTAAGALMDSELTSEASVKALNQGVATTDSPTFAAVTVNGNVEFDGLSGTGAVTVTDILDQDDMSSNSATALATQQSIKAYVDTTVAATNELVEDTTPQLGGDLASNGNDILFADNDKAVFGAGSDLQIYHSGSHSVIEDSGTGNLFIKGTNLSLRDADGNDYITMVDGGSGGTVSLLHLGSTKLATTSTGIDVTGVITTDGMTTSADVNFGDNDKAVFGAGPDLRIYHDGSNSYINDTTGTGNLYIASNQLIINNAANSENMARFAENGAATLYYDGAPKIATTSTGIDVTGTVVADGLDVQGNVIINNSYAYQIGGDSASSSVVGKMHNSSGMFTLASLDSRHMKLTTSNADRLKVDANGDISFYEDTGTTAKLFWDASAESLGIGTSSPSQDLEILNGSTGAGIRLAATGSAYWDIERDSTSGHLTFTDDGAGTVLTVGQDGNVGIGTDSPNSIVDIRENATGGQARLRLFNTDQTNSTAQSALLFMSPDLRANGVEIEAVKENADFSAAAGRDIAIVFKPVLNNAATERMRISSDGSCRWTPDGTNPDMTLTADGNLLVGKTSTGAATAGIELNGASDILRVARDGGAPLELNRITSGGTIAEFRQNNVTVGSIGAASGERLYIGDGDVALRFANDLDFIAPWNASTNAARTGEIDLGNASNRFKDLYLSGFISGGSNVGLSTRAIASGGTTGVQLQQARGSISSPTTSVAGGDGNFITSSVYNGSAFNKIGQIGIVTGTSLDDGDIVFATAKAGSTTTKMTLDEDGNLLVGKTSTSASLAGLRLENTNGNQGTITISKTVSGNVNAIINYHNGTYIGGVNYSDTATSFPTSSDQRLKDNIVDAPSASDDIDAIQVRSFDWKVNGSHQKYGMVAQELQGVAPEAVSEGETEEDMMGVDYSKLVPMMLKEIQSLRARVAQLEGEN